MTQFAKGHKPVHKDSTSRLEALIASDPDGAAALLDKISKKIFRPHTDGQREVLMAEERFLTLCAGRRWGKELRVDEPVLTPLGWEPIGKLRVGDRVYGTNGQTTTVTGVYPQGNKPLFTLKVKDGTQIECGAEHQWVVRRRWRKGRANIPEVKTTQELIDDGVLMNRTDCKTEYRFAVPAPEPVHFAEKEYVVAPYVLGALLGDGCLASDSVSLASADEELFDEVEHCLQGVAALSRHTVTEGKCPIAGIITRRGQPNPVLDDLRSRGLLTRSEHKHVPQDYLEGSVEQRLSLLRGLMDTDGWLESSRRCAFASASEKLTDAVRTLALSLGGKVTPIQRRPTTHLDSFVLRFYMPEGQCPFKLDRKASRWLPTPSERLARQIISIEPSTPAEAVCIAVDAPDEQFLIRDFLPTHNTKVGAARALRECRRERKMVWWVAPTYKIVKRGYQEVLRQLPEGVLSKPAPPESGFDAGRALALHFKNGSKMEFYSAERPEGMLGGACDFIIVDEAATMPEASWTQFMRPTLADTQGGALFISTPRGKNWFYKMWSMGQDELQGKYKSWRFPSFTNPTIPREEFEEMEQTLPAAVYEQEVLAEFISASASVFRLPDGAVVPMQPPAGHVVLGIDLAKLRDFSVIFGVRTGDRKPCYHERFNAVSWPMQRLRIHQAVEKITATPGVTGITVMLDSTGLGDVVYDDLSFEGLDAIPVKFTSQWKQQAVALLGADLERGQAFITETQRNEFESYGYTISESTGRWKFEAQTGHDDEVAAALLAHWGVVNYGVPDVHMISSGGGSDYVDVEAVEEEVLVLRQPSAMELLTNPDCWR